MGGGRTLLVTAPTEEGPLRFRIPHPVSRKVLALRLRIARMRQGMNLLGSVLDGRAAENRNPNDEGMGQDGSERDG